MTITIRPTISEDAPNLKEWFKEPGVLNWFPMQNEYEIDDSIRLWMYYADLGAGLTAVCGDKVAGMIIIYINPFQKLIHTCLFSIIVSPEFRKQGIATLLIKECQKMAKEKFNIEWLHLEVYEGNSKAYKLYEKMGFSTYGVQKKFIKEHGRYLDKILMQKKL